MTRIPVSKRDAAVLNKLANRWFWSGVVICTLVVLYTASQQDSTYGQGMQPTLCKATNLTATVNAPATVWIPGPPSAGRRFTWNWSINYDCTNGNFTNCAVDEKVEYIV